MKWFFDSSVLVPALLPEKHEHHARSFAAFAAAGSKNAGCAAHGLAEVYATLTKYPGKQRLSAESADLLVQEIEHRLTLVWLDAAAYYARHPPHRKVRNRGRGGLRRAGCGVRTQGRRGPSLHMECAPL